jgi:hypothetical protein
VVLKYFSQQKKTRYIGEVILGFGLLFYGMTVMKLGLAPIKSDPAFLAFFTKFDPSSVGGLLLCVVVGAGLTIMVQSSSATIGLTMTLASQGLLTFPGAMALVLGENIGTTITAELATIGSNNINAHRAARAHTMFNVLGVTLMLCVFPLFVKAGGNGDPGLGAGPVDQVVGDDVVNIARYIANGHTMFNVINASFFPPGAALADQGGHHAFSQGGGGHRLLPAAQLRRPAHRYTHRRHRRSPQRDPANGRNRPVHLPQNGQAAWATGTTKNWPSGGRWKIIWMTCSGKSWPI